MIELDPARLTLSPFEGSQKNSGQYRWQQKSLHAHDYIISTDVNGGTVWKRCCSTCRLSPGGNTVPHCTQNQTKSTIFSQLLPLASAAGVRVGDTRVPV
jgi:hypothetical protein